MNWLIKSISALSPGCKEAIRLQSEALDHPLPPLRRIGLRIHLVLCNWCARYGKQIKFLRVAAKRCDEDLEPKQTLPPEAWARLKRSLNACKH